MSKTFRFLAVETSDPLHLSSPFSARFPDPIKYLPAKGLCEAFDAAMLLGMPLLLTGEPGTGKTRAAYWLARQLGARLLRHDVKSTSTGRDLLYSFDEVARFRDASAARPRPLIDYIRFSALGEAIVRASAGAALAPLRSGAQVPADAFAGDPAALTVADLLPEDPAFTAETPPAHSVVLIDELDKAPRDTPNDLLAEVEHMAFDVPELGIRITAQTDWRPIVVITSNSERALPEPFLRRCLYFDIPPPEEGELAEIVALSIDGVAAGTRLFVSAWRFYDALREAEGVRKRPGTAEFLVWTSCLVAQAGYTPGEALGNGADHRARIAPTLICLVKAFDDLAIARRLLADSKWLSTRGGSGA